SASERLRGCAGGHPDGPGDAWKSLADRGLGALGLRGSLRRSTHLEAVPGDDLGDALRLVRVGQEALGDLDGGLLADLGEGRADGEGQVAGGRFAPAGDAELPVHLRLEDDRG